MTQQRFPEGARPHRPSPFDIWLCPKDGLEYAFIPHGVFEMGASPGDTLAFTYEMPRHQVQLTRGFWFCRTPVTAAAFHRFC